MSYNYSVINYGVIKNGENMALRNHSLDEKITASAMTEFSEKGYTGASLRKIAENAGVTVGAIQTRYKSKNELFEALIKPLLDDALAMFKSVKADYYSSAGEDIISGLKTSMRHESAALIRLIFDHYDEAKLLMCKSSGSRLESWFDDIVQRKIEESAAYFRSSNCQVDEKLLGLLISSQFDSYRRIVIECTDRQSAEEYMDSLITYHYGGWCAFFDSFGDSREEK